MNNNIKVLVVVIIIVLMTYVCIYCYIHMLNNEIETLKNIELSQKEKINVLTQNINTLEKGIKAKDDIISVTDNYINDVIKVHLNETAIKKTIYEEIVNDQTDEIKEWFNEKLPNPIINILDTSFSSRMCENGN